MGPQNVRMWRDSLKKKKAITRERNEISSTNSVYKRMSTIFGQIKNIEALPLGGAIRLKYKNSYNNASVSSINLKIVMKCLCPMCHKCL